MSLEKVRTSCNVSYSGRTSYCIAIKYPRNNYEEHTTSTAAKKEITACSTVDSALACRLYFGGFHYTLSLLLFGPETRSVSFHRRTALLDTSNGSSLLSGCVTNGHWPYLEPRSTQRKWPSFYNNETNTSV